MGGLEAYINGWKIELLDVFNQSGMGNKYADINLCLPQLYIKTKIEMRVTPVKLRFYSNLALIQQLRFLLMQHM